MSLAYLVAAVLLVTGAAYALRAGWHGVGRWMNTPIDILAPLKGLSRWWRRRPSPGRGHHPPERTRRPSRETTPRKGVGRTRGEGDNNPEGGRDTSPTPSPRAPRRGTREGGREHPRGEKRGETSHRGETGGEVREKNPRGGDVTVNVHLPAQKTKDEEKPVADTQTNTGGTAGTAEKVPDHIAQGNQLAADIEGVAARLRAAAEDAQALMARVVAHAQAADKIGITGAPAGKWDDAANSARVVAEATGEAAAAAARVEEAVTDAAQVEQATLARPVEEMSTAPVRGHVTADTMR